VPTAERRGSDAAKPRETNERRAPRSTDRVDGASGRSPDGLESRRTPRPPEAPGPPGARNQLPRTGKKPSTTPSKQVAAGAKRRAATRTGKQPPVETERTPAEPKGRPSRAVGPGWPSQPPNVPGASSSERLPSPGSQRTRAVGPGRRSANAGNAGWPPPTQPDARSERASWPGLSPEVLAATDPHPIALLVGDRPEPRQAVAPTTDHAAAITAGAPAEPAALLGTAPKRRRRGRNVGLIIGAIVAGLGVVVAAAVLAKPADRSALAATPATSASVSARWTSVEETFDSLPMNSKLPATWIVSGPGSAEVIALPTSVDRSVRLGSSPAGDVTSACRPTAVVLGGPIRIAVDYAVGRPPASPVPLITIDSGTARQVAIGMDASGHAVSMAADGTTNAGEQPPVPSAATPSGSGALWQRLEVTFDLAKGVAGWQLHDTSGALTASGQTDLASPAPAPDTICFLSPEGSPSGWIAIDDLFVGG
jgi:hypothetical protein